MERRMGASPVLGWCESGHHHLCPGVLPDAAFQGEGKNAKRMDVKCACDCAHDRCRVCGRRGLELDDTNRCADAEDCHEYMKAKPKHPAVQQIEQIRHESAEKARKSRENNRRSACASKSAEGRDDTSERQREGRCHCCGGATKGGRFLPGHDAKLKGMLNREGTPEAMAERAARGWDQPTDEETAAVIGLDGDADAFIERRVRERLEGDGDGS